MSGWLLLVPTDVQATDSQVGAIICADGSPGASIDITQPNDDSIVNQAVTTFRGTVSYASQIEIRVDGQYSGTLALGANQTAFSVDVTLQTGTHTITLIANDICGGSNGSDAIVITYQPAVNPSDGGSVPTNVGDGGSGVIIAPQESAPIEGVNGVTDEAPVSQPAIGVLADGLNSFGAAIGLDRTVAEVNTVTAAGRIALTVTALTSIALAGAIAPMAIQMVPGISEAFHATGPRLRGYVGWTIRGIGVLAFGLAAIL